MYTTAGIVAAVPPLFFHHLYRSAEIMNEMEAGATNLMTVFEANNDFLDETSSIGSGRSRIGEARKNRKR